MSDDPLLNHRDRGRNPVEEEAEVEEEESWEFFGPEAYEEWDEMGYEEEE